MESVIQFLKNRDYVRCSWWVAIIADILYLIGVIQCAVVFFQTSESTVEGKYIREKGIIDYLTENFMSQTLVKVGMGVFVVSFLMFCMSYIIMQKDAGQVLMLVCLTIVLGILMTYIIPTSSIMNVLGTEDLELIKWFIIGTVLLTMFITAVVDERYRGTGLLVFGSLLWQAVGVYVLIFSVITLLAVLGIAIAFLVFSGRSGGDYHIMIEKDSSGNVIREWREMQ